MKITTPLHAPAGGSPGSGSANASNSSQGGSPGAGNHEPTFNRSIGPFALMLVGLGSIVGSGWLFGSWRASNIAGPAAICAWIIGAVLILFISLSYSELIAMFPDPGAMARYSRYSHGALVGFIAAWANYIANIAIVPIEAVASAQYLSGWDYAWCRDWCHSLESNGELTMPGVAVAIVLMVGYFFLNYFGVKLFARVNSAITIFKFVVPALTVIAMIWASFHPSNMGLSSMSTFAPQGWSAVFVAVSGSGIVFAFNGFQSPINMAGEAKNPSRSVPFAIIGSLILSLIIYLLLQIAYLGALDPKLIAQGWTNIQFRSPFADLAVLLNLGWLAILLQVDAFISPSGTGSIYTASSARMIYAMERNNTLPAVLGVVHPVYRVPRNAMYFNFVASLLLLFVFRGWNALAPVISIALVISYMTGPVSLMAIKRAFPDMHQPIKIPGMKLWSPLGFIFSSLILYWGEWPTTGWIILLIVVALPVFFYYAAKNGWQNWAADKKAGWWMVCYLPAMAILSALGSFGGYHIIPYGWDMVVVVIVSYLFYVWSVRSGYRTPYINEAKENQTDELLRATD